MFWRWLICLLEACVEKCKDCTRLYSLKEKCPKNILAEFRFDSLNGYHELIFRRNVIELDLNKHLRFFCCSVYNWSWVLQLDVSMEKWVGSSDFAKQDAGLVPPFIRRCILNRMGFTHIYVMHKWGDYGFFNVWLYIPYSDHGIHHTTLPMA